MKQVDWDVELVTQQLIQAEESGRQQEVIEEHHRCPSSMPPCPSCQELDDLEDEE